MDNYSVHDLFTTTDSDIERQFRIADIKLGREGIGMAYGNRYMDMSDTTAFKVDVILFVADEECMNRLHSYAETRFHGLNDEYRRYIATIDSEKFVKITTALFQMVILLANIISVCLRLFRCHMKWGEKNIEIIFSSAT